MKGLVSYRRPVVLIVIIDAIAFSLLFLYKQPFDWYVLPAGLLVIGLICASFHVITRKSLGDEYLFLITAMLTSLGFIMIYRLDPVYGFRQIMWFSAGILLFFLSFFVFLKFRFWHRLFYYYVSISLALFILTLSLGESVKGSKNWLEIGKFSFQPSELIKILFILSLACCFSKSEQVIFKGLSISFPQSPVRYRIVLALVSYMPLGFLVLQREWGTAIVFFLVYATLVYAFDDSPRFFALNAAAAVLGAVAGYMTLYHIRVRVETWLDPWKDIAGKGYQITQSLFAIAEGGFFGTGIGMGRPDLIPAVNTDFIFSAICEEMGIFGGVAVILLYFILTYRGVKISLRVKNPFYRATALGITLMFGFQTFIIIGGVIKLIPLTGITLPFVSYGGSSLTTSFIALGMLQAVSVIAEEPGTDGPGPGADKFEPGADESGSGAGGSGSEADESGPETSGIGPGADGSEPASVVPEAEIHGPGAELDEPGPDDDINAEHIKDAECRNLDNSGEKGVAGSNETDK